MYRNAVIMLILSLCAALPAQQHRRAEGFPSGARGVTIPTVEIAPTTWGSLFLFQTANAYPGTYSVDRTTSLGGSNYQNYQVGVNGYNYYGFSEIVRSRILYIFDTSTLSNNFSYELAGTMITGGVPFSQTMEIFDAEDFGLQNGAPFTGDGTTAVIGNGAGTPFATRLTTDADNNFSFDVTSQVLADLGANNDFSGFLLGMQDDQPLGQRLLWGFVNVGLNSAAPPVPTMGEWTLIGFIITLMGFAVVFSIRQRRQSAI